MTNKQSIGGFAAWQLEGDLIVAMPTPKQVPVTDPPVDPMSDPAQPPVGDPPPPPGPTDPDPYEMPDPIPVPPTPTGLASLNDYTSLSV